MEQGKAEANMVFDREDLLVTVGGDTEILEELVGMFLGVAPDQMESIKTALGRGDYLGAGREAHKLKGTAGNLRALFLHAAFAVLEESAKERDPTGTAMSLAACASEFQRFREVFETGS
jgi:histidine phosphotransfer protein HptB